MNENPQSQKKIHNIKVVAIIATVLSVLAFFNVGQANSKIDELENRLKAVEPEQVGDTANMSTSEDTTLTSGKGGFTMRVPAGWGLLTKDKSSDTFFITGMGQPYLGKGAITRVQDVEGYGSDNAMLFMATLSKDGWDKPRGAAEDFTIGAKEEPITGKKYSYIYPKDEIVGIGWMRYQNEREYQYVFDAGDGRKLTVVYNVYGSDPHNHAATVDEIVRSIVVKK